MSSFFRWIALAVTCCAVLPLLGCGGKEQREPTSLTSPSAGSASPAPVPGLPPRTIRGNVIAIDGQPLPGVRLTSAFGGTVISDTAGAFAFSYPSRTDPSPCWLVADLPGFDSRQVGWGLGAEDVTLAPFVLQRTLVIRQDAPAIADAIYPADLLLSTGEAYESDLCGPCRSIVLEAPVGRGLRVDLEWSGDVPLQLWAWLGVSSNDVLTTSFGNGSSRASLTFYPPKDRTILHLGLPYERTVPAALTQPVPFKLTAIVQ